MINVSGTSKHEPRVKRTPFIKKFGSCYNRFNPEDGILLDFETENGVHYIRISREAASELARDLREAEHKWNVGYKTSSVTVDDQNGT